MQKKTPLFTILLITLMSPCLHIHSMEGDTVDPFKDMTERGLFLRNQIKKQIKIKDESGNLLEQCLQNNKKDLDECLPLEMNHRVNLDRLSDLLEGKTDKNPYSDAISEAVKESTKLRQTLDDARKESEAWRNKIPSARQVAGIGGSSLIFITGLIPFTKGAIKMCKTKGKEGKLLTTLGVSIAVLGAGGMYYFSSAK